MTSAALVTAIAPFADLASDDLACSDGEGASLLAAARSAQKFEATAEVAALDVIELKAAIEFAMDQQGTVAL